VSGGATQSSEGTTNQPTPAKKEKETDKREQGKRGKRGKRRTPMPKKGDREREGGGGRAEAQGEKKKGAT
jgi:hypothetical protein